MNRDLPRLVALLGITLVLPGCAMQRGPVPFAWSLVAWPALVLVSGWFLTGCATLRGAARSTCIDRQVVQALVCEGREAEAAVYIERGGGGDNEIIEFLVQSRAKRDAGKCPGVKGR